jgi:membrane-associated phospholipid phosphatase
MFKPSTSGECSNVNSDWTGAPCGESRASNPTGERNPSHCNSLVADKSGERLNRSFSLGLAAGGAILCILASIRFADEPAARLSYQAFGRPELLERFLGGPHFFGPLAALVILAFAARRLLGRPFSYADGVLVLCVISESITAMLLFPLKHFFGRTWPLYGHPSLLVDGVDGFNFFRSGPGYEAFPSGHTAAVCAIGGVLWAAYPKLRPLWGAIIAAAAIPLVLGDFHFVSDVLAGGLLGVLVSGLCILTFERYRPWIRPLENRR